MPVLNGFIVNKGTKKAITKKSGDYGMSDFTGNENQKIYLIYSENNVISLQVGNHNNELIGCDQTGDISICLIKKNLVGLPDFCRWSMKERNIDGKLYYFLQNKQTHKTMYHDIRNDYLQITDETNEDQKLWEVKLL